MNAGRNRGGRPRKATDEKLGTQLAIRLNAELLARLDRHVERLSARTRGVIWTRGSAIRELMLTSLAAAERVAQSAEPPAATTATLQVPGQPA